jgi:hypothetical protein
VPSHRDHYRAVRHTPPAREQLAAQLTVRITVTVLLCGD